MTEQTPKPTPPADHECCGGGCSPCVWDRYYEALHRWQSEQAKKNQSRAG